MQNMISERSGIGLRSQHVRELLDRSVPIGFLEAHSENYFGGGHLRQQIRQIAEKYPLTLHGVGLSLGRADGLDQSHLRQIKTLVDEVNPVFISEHLTWSAYSHRHVPDLLPIPFIAEALDVFVDHVQEFQDGLGRQVLIENPSNYLAFERIDYSETEFLNELVKRTGCGLLLDINNIAVSAYNLGYDPVAYLDGINQTNHVQQFHLAGYQVNELDNGEKIFLDTHGMPVYPDVWALYAHALQRFGDLPTLIEWDTDIPALDVLVAEAAKADQLRNRYRETRHGRAA